LRTAKLAAVCSPSVLSNMMRCEATIVPMSARWAAAAADCG
jgi:hypothetical protein